MACGWILMVVVAIYRDGIVIGAVAVDHDPPLPGYFGHEPCEVELVALPQRRRPLEDEDEAVNRPDIQGEVERRARIRRPIDQHLMAERLRHPGIVVDVLRTADSTGLESHDVVSEHQPHRTQPQHSMISINSCRRAAWECLLARCRRMPMTVSA